jgi:hypothetical protein
VGVAIGEEHDALALLFEDRGERIFSPMLRAHKGLLSWDEEQTKRSFSKIYRPCLTFGRAGEQALVLTEDISVQRRPFS